MSTQAKVLSQYTEQSNLSSSITRSLDSLISSPQLPESPYSSLISSLRLAESSSQLLSPPSVEAVWLESLQSGDNLGAYNVQRRRVNREIEGLKSNNMMSLSLNPGYNGSIVGLPHVLQFVDVVGLAGVANVVKDLEKVIYPKGVIMNKKSEVSESE